jgi:CubicO group peptidase (beta-lactamase class C family)
MTLKTLPILLLALLAAVPALDAQNTGAHEKGARMGSVIRQIDQYIQDGMEKTGVPGLAVAIVYHDKVVYLKGYGVRKVGERARIDPDTVFQLASLSKPIASTIVASLVGTHEVNWDDRIIDLDRRFRLSDPSVTQRLSIRDLLSHRSGLPTSAGDALEDLGFSQPVILRQMRLLPLPGTFRKTFQYSNFGFTEGAVAAAKAVRKPWADLAYERLFKPLGMNSSSYRYSDYEGTANKAIIHLIEDGKAIPRYHRDPDAEAPAGAASSSIRDVAEWLRLQLGNGTWEGQCIVAPDALDETHSPQIQKGTDPNGNPTYYGLGWNVDKDAAGKLILSHSGAFFLGTGTTVKFSPSEQLGILMLTNGTPTGLVEAVANTFFDIYNTGAPTRDWLTIFSAAFKSMIEEGNNATTDYSKLTPPASPSGGKALSTYTGTYGNNYYGKIEITEQHGSLWMRLPDNGALYTLSHWDNDTFTYRFEAEQGIGTRGVVFTTGGKSSVLVENLALEGNGVFIKNAEERP